MSFENDDYIGMDAEELYEYGFELLENEDTENAIKYITLAAEQGCVEAQGHLAEIYRDGVLVEENLEESFKWCKLAATNGDLIPQHYLAEAYHYGYGVEVSIEDAVKWHKIAGLPDDCWTLGHMYYYGTEVEQDYEQAYYWFDKIGFRDVAYYICADMYFYVDKDYQNAFRLYHEALNEGVEEAAYKIGEMYYYGLGVEQDYSEAFEFLKYYNGEFDEFYFDDAPAKVHRMLAEMYKNGWGVEKNLEEADKLFRAAKKGQDY